MEKIKNFFNIIINGFLRFDPVGTFLALAIAHEKGLIC